MSPSMRNSAPLPLAPADAWLGDRTLLTWPTHAILNSRQGACPHGGEAWVQRTVEAAMRCARAGSVLVTGIGLPTWELGLWGGAQALGSAVIVTPVDPRWPRERVDKALHAVLDDFGLMRQDCLVVPYHDPGKAPKRLWPARDRWVLEQAGTWVPVSYRPDGFFARALRERAEGARIDERFLADYSPEKARYSPAPDPEQASNTLSALDFPFAIHWTRTCRGPWPGESRDAYYTDLVASRHRYPRSALDTLRRILREGRIRGSGWRMPLQRPMVSLSAAAVEAQIERMRWRRRYARPSYEPYGIAVSLSALERLGGHAVSYGPAGQGPASLRERLFYQSVDPEGEDWSQEAEWRTNGDLDLSRLAEDEAAVLVPTREEAERIGKEARFPTLHLSVK